MPYFDETEAQRRFDELLERALDGELIVITSSGVPIVEVRPVVGFVDWDEDTI